MERVKPETQARIKDALTGLIGEQGVTAFAQSIGVKRDDVNNWISGKSDIRVTALISIAKRYNVSTDYILGLSDTKSLDVSYASAETLLGINREAIDELKEVNNSICVPASHVKDELLSHIITSPGFADLIKTITELVILANDIEENVNCGRGFTAASKEMNITIDALDNKTLALKYGRYAGAESFGRILDSLLSTPASDLVEYAEDFVNSGGEDHSGKH